MAVGGENLPRTIGVDPGPGYAAPPLPPPAPRQPLPPPTLTSRGPIASLDGLRALAVLIVVVSHAGYGNTIPGGLGVTIFFFLSGFLITTLILDEHERHGRISIKQFYQRRAFRLLPPLLVTLAIAYLLVGAGLLDGGFTVQGLTSQLFYFANYFTIFFAHANSQPGGSGILWSLAVEEHFYLVFPVVMLLVFRRFGPHRARTVLIRAFVVLCVAALAWRCYLVSQPGFNQLHTYYSTDTRFDSILFGCLLALWYNPARLPLQVRDTKMRAKDWLLCAAGLALLLATIVYRDVQFRESFRYTLQGLALVPIFFYAIRFPQAGPFRLLNLRAIARIGVLSYGIYLIHDIFLEALATDVHVSMPSWLRFGLAVGVSVVFATILDRYIDPYFRRKRAALH